MPDPYVREVGRLTEADGFYTCVGVNYGLVTIQIGGVRAALTQAQAEEFGQLFIRACWEAAADTPDPD